MATEILFSELKAWLDAQPENTASTPYEITIKNAPSGGGRRYANAITRYVRIVGMEMAAGVTKIEQEAFLSCTNLIYINIPNGITSINGQAFQGCSNLISATLPAGLTSIGFGAFSGCHGLKSVNIPYGVTSIGDSAFRNCYALNAIQFLGTLTSIGDNAFMSCKELSFVYVYVPFSETLMKSESFKYTPSNLRLLVYPTALSSWQSAPPLTNYGFGPGVKVESLYTKWVRVV